MEIKTTADIIKDNEDTAEHILNEEPEIEIYVGQFDETYLKKWVAVDDIIKCIDDTYKDLDMGKTIPIFIQRLKDALSKKTKLSADKSSNKNLTK